MPSLLTAILSRLSLTPPQRGLRGLLPLRSDRAKDLFVIADPADSTVSLSPALAAHIARTAGQGAALLIVFRILGTDRYGFAPATEAEAASQLAALDFDKGLRCWGFTAVCPTVAQIFARWGYDPFDTRRLRVIYRRGGAKPYYELCRR